MANNCSNHAMLERSKDMSNKIVVTEDNQYWIIDTNKWQKSICNKDEAIEFSKTLVNCTNCINCRDCTNCIDCRSCGDCKNCRDCSSCRDCSDCGDSRSCRYCIDCRDCSDCGDSRSCSYCSYCSDCTNCIDCRSCRDCTNCRDCSSCRDCSDSRSCSSCSYCHSCRSCRDFKTNPERITSPIIGSRNSQTTFYWNAEKEQVVCGCFKGTLQEFEAAINKTHGDNEYSKSYFAWIEKVKIYCKQRDAKIN